ncbi:MAG TPA: hypothetical protein VEH84_04110 [Alphaproteobacteria bacterium]|nr:hypothetical protein [Alphaproteobacteria bacterium]
MRAFERWIFGVALTLSGLLAGAGGQAQDADRAAWVAARQAGTVAAYQGYLTKFPSGRFAGLAFDQIVALTGRPPARTGTTGGAGGSAGGGAGSGGGVAPTAIPY